MNKTITEELRPLLLLTLGLLVITSIAYPLAVTGLGQALFHQQANGSVLEIQGKAIGSSLIGQNFTSDRYFHGRPSNAGAGYDASSSSASDLGPTSALLIQGVHSKDPSATEVDGVVDRVAAFRTENGLPGDTAVPADAVTGSGSGLDPDISPATALAQVDRVARARNVDAVSIRQLVAAHTERRILGVIGEPRINVLQLNLALDAMSGK